jgi:hypothetical protein
MFSFHCGGCYSFKIVSFFCLGFNLFLVRKKSKLYFQISYARIVVIEKEFEYLSTAQSIREGGGIMDLLLIIAIIADVVTIVSAIISISTYIYKYLKNKNHKK